MKEIELVQGYTAIVDDEDYERVAQYYWRFDSGAVRASDPKRSNLGHFILEISDPHCMVGYINGDCMDNRRSNLQVMNHS